MQIPHGAPDSEIRTFEFDRLSPGAWSICPRQRRRRVAPFRYAESKVDLAPDSILVNRKATAVIKE